MSTSLRVTESPKSKGEIFFWLLFLLSSCVERVKLNILLVEMFIFQRKSDSSVCLFFSAILILTTRGRSATLLRF